MGQDHGVVIVEREDDVLVALGHLQVLDGAVALPHVAADDEGALRLTLAQCLVYLRYERVPLLVVVGHRLVHELIGHGVVAVALQHVAQLVPHIDELLLGLLDERMLELCWEGWRRQDLIRFGKYRSLYTGPDAIDESDGHTTVFPIPGDVVTLNNKIHQNKGY
ncbi:MAG: RagB/SusD family nutrient uptake outer membrane protein [Prevotella sp.]|nr:RagB/SusD family nutrient uptake outer membrane protein [Prevotella sp.]